MQFSPPLQPATLVQRYKRFLADVITPDGTALTLHCPNTGAMTGCATPGDTVWYSTSDSAKRKYPHTWEITQTQNGTFICINTLRANTLAKEAILSGVIPELQGYSVLKSEWGRKAVPCSLQKAEAGQDPPHPEDGFAVPAPEAAPWPVSRRPPATAG